MIDSQVHLWLPNTADRPWPAYSGKMPTGPQQLPEPILSMMDETGVDGAVIVPPIWAGDDNGPQLEWCAKYPGRFGVMGRFDMWDREAADLRTWLDQPGMLGIRLSYAPERGKVWLEPDRFPWFWAEAERAGIPVMLLVSGPDVARLAPIAERHPDLKLIIDHLGLGIGDPAKIDPLENFEDLLALARYPNIYGKISSMAAYTLDDYPFRSLDAPIQAALAAFGADRLMWGTDITRLRGCTYQEAFDHVRLLPFLTESDRQSIFGGTAAKVLDWQTAVADRFGV